MSTFHEKDVLGVFSDYQKQGSIQLVDVREDDEFADVSVPFSRLLPLSKIREGASLDALAFAKDLPVYVICRSGKRSAAACEMFHMAGFQNLVNVAGGIIAWELAGLPVKRS